MPRKSETAKSVGFIGLGRIGMPMCRNLLRAGFSLTVHNRSRGNVDEMALLGASPAHTPAEVAGASQVVLTCLPDVANVEEVFLGSDGLLAATRPGQILVDHSTVGPSTSKTIASSAANRGAQFLDAPISGGVERAADATLTIMVGGEESAFQEALPVFHAMGQNVHHVGPTGAGSVVKLVNQLLVGIHSLATAEAMLLGQLGGADPHQLLEILSTSWGQSFMLSRNGPTIVERDFSGARAQVQTILKDLRLIQEFASAVGSPTPAGDQAVLLFQQAVDQGHADRDPASLILLLEEMAAKPVSGA